MVIFNNIILILEKYWGLFLQGIGVTLMLSAIAVAFGILIGSLLALMRLSKFHIGRFRPLDFILSLIHISEPTRSSVAPRCCFSCTFSSSCCR